MKPEIKELVRKEYHHLDTTYFNTAYFGPSPYSAKQKVSRALQKELDPSFHNYATWMGIPERMRVQLARLIGCKADNVCHTNSTSDVMNIIANGYKFKKGDVVCSIDKEYPSNILPWMLGETRYDYDFHLLKLGNNPVPTAEWLAEHLPKNCRIFNVSYIQFDTGKKIDLIEIGKLCRERDIMFVVDATQALGGMPITADELKLIDVLACSSYKWVLGPYGHAFAYFSDDALKKVHHNNANWITSPNSKVVYHLLDYTIDTLPGARKFDRGQAATPLINACLESGLEFLNEIGLENVQKHNLELRDRFLDKYPKDKFSLITPKDHMGNIVALKALNIDSIDLERELKFRNIDISVREGNIRLSFHIFNTTKQVDALIRALDI